MKKRQKMLVWAAAAYMAISMMVLILNSRKRKRKERLSISYGPIEERDRMRIEYLNNKIWKNDTNCVNMLRLGRAPFFRFCNLFRTRGLLVDTIHMCVEQQVAMFLNTVGHNLRNRLVGTNYDRSGETVSRYFHIVLHAIGELRDELIRRPSLETQSKIEGNPRWDPYFKDCVGAIDGTHVRASVTKDMEAAFRGRKSFPSQNVLVAVDFDLRFTYVLAGWEGTAHDALVLRDALERPNGLRVPQGKFYLVDGGYGAKRGFLPPFRGVRYHLNEWGNNPVQNEKELFNLRHSSLRVGVERGIGSLKRRFKVLDDATPFFPFPTQMSDLSEPSKEGSSADGSSAHQKTGVWSSMLSTLLQQASVYGLAAGYCLSASLLSIINKWAIMKFPYPGALTALQYLTSVAGVLLCGQAKLIEHDGLNWRTMWKFLPAAVMFYISIFTNSELLLHANVDTFIVFRSAVPIFVAIGETLYLHQPWPSLKTWLSLSTILGGSVIYVFTDNQFTVAAYSWAVAYLVSMSIDFVYIKHVVMTIGLNTWGLVLYNNLEALMLFPIELLLMGEFRQMKVDSSKMTNWLSFDVILPVALSCLFGLSISFFGFSCRRAISATGFTVLGIVNKLLTVVVNLLIWDKHASLMGTIGLLICMSGGVLYQQSTTKPKAPSVEPKEENDEEEQKLLEMQQGHESSPSQEHAS